MQVCYNDVIFPAFRTHAAILPYMIKRDFICYEAAAAADFLRAYLKASRKTRKNARGAGGDGSYRQDEWPRKRNVCRHCGMTKTGSTRGLRLTHCRVQP